MKITKFFTKSFLHALNLDVANCESYKGAWPSWLILFLLVVL